MGASLPGEELAAEVQRAMDTLGIGSGLKQGNRRTSTAPMGAQLTGVISSFRAVAADSITIEKATTSCRVRRKREGGFRCDLDVA